MTAVNKGSRMAVLKKWVTRTIVIISLGWTIVNWSALAEITEKLSEVAFFLILLTVSEACFIIGAVLVAIGMGGTIFAGAGKNPLNWLKALWHVRNTYKKFVVDAPRSGIIRLGFHLNWFGALQLVPSQRLALWLFCLLHHGVFWFCLCSTSLRVSVGEPPFSIISGGNAGAMSAWARPHDIPAIVALDASRYEDITPEYADHPEAMFECGWRMRPSGFA